MAARVNALSKTFVWILMGLLMLGLAGFGAVNLSGTVRTVAEVGDETVSVDAYARELQREIRAVEAQIGEPLPMTRARELGLDRIALSRLIALASLDNEVRQLGVSVGDENLQREIVSIPAFQGTNGQFDRESYRFQLEQAGISETEFEEDLRKESARTLIQAAVMDGVRMPSTLSDTLAEFVGARRSFTMATVTAEQLEEPITAPTDAEVAAFYEENTDRFMLPQTKRITYALLSPAMLIDEVELDEESVRRLYEQREAEFNQPARRLVERLVFADQDAAESAKAQLEVGGSSFEQLVENRGLNLSDIDMGDMTARDLGDAAEGVFAAEVGEVVGPLPSDLGPALYRVNGVLAEQITEFEQVADELRDELAAERARRLIEARAEDINDLLAGGATLEDLAKETSMELGQVDWTEDSSDGVTAYAEFRSAAEAVTLDDFPEVDFLEDGSIFAIRLDEELEPRPEPLETARDTVAATLEAQRLSDALVDRAETLRSTLAETGDFNETGLPVQVENALTRSAFLDGVPQGFMAEIFEMEEGELRVIPAPGLALIVRLDEVLPPAETDELQQMRQALDVQLGQALAQNLFDIYARTAQSRAQPMLDQQALNAVQSNF
ncbi:peptidyl-prolyl cis-trans isomerase [Lutimaribacter marinistellae]|uniref:Parvulin-like PPIase n=1 Tax=Lutimaribacter marinistellae TaxID=1820329 RepID=A0ABV7TN08_9RHOB